MTSENQNRQPAMWEGLEPEGEPGQPAPAPAPPKGEPRLQAVNRQQMVFRTVDVERLIEDDHPARAIWELVGKLDLSSFHQAISAVEGVAGRPALDPQLLISLWIYAYSEGVSSAREVARLCEYHPAYQWLTGLNRSITTACRISGWGTQRPSTSCSPRCWGCSMPKAC